MECLSVVENFFFSWICCFCVCGEYPVEGVLGGEDVFYFRAGCCFQEGDGADEDVGVWDESACFAEACEGFVCGVAGFPYLRGFQVDVRGKEGQGVIGDVGGKCHYSTNTLFSLIYLSKISEIFDI